MAIIVFKMFGYVSIISMLFYGKFIAYFTFSSDVVDFSKWSQLARQSILIQLGVFKFNDTGSNAANSSADTWSKGKVATFPFVQVNNLISAFVRQIIFTYDRGRNNAKHLLQLLCYNLLKKVWYSYLAYRYLRRK